MKFDPITLFRKAKSAQSIANILQDANEKTNTLRESITPKTQQLAESLNAQLMTFKGQLGDLATDLAKNGYLPENYQELAHQFTQFEEYKAQIHDLPGGEALPLKVIKQIINEKSATVAERLETIGEFASSVGEAVEIASDSALGAGVSYAMYQALKEFLSLEGARQRGEITNKAVVEYVIKIAWEAGRKGAAFSTIFGIAVMIFGGWILVPLSIIAPFAGIKMTISLWEAFWNGLNDTQQQEIVDKANEVGGDISQFFNNLRPQCS